MSVCETKLLIKYLYFFTYITGINLIAISTFGLLPSEYAPILKGYINLRTGNNQELLDLKFKFIKGKPPRNVVSVENIYPYADYKYEYLAYDS